MKASISNKQQPHGCMLLACEVDDNHHRQLDNMLLVTYETTGLLSIMLLVWLTAIRGTIGIHATEAIGCWQCGVFFRGIRDECNLADRQYFNCTACLKTYTKTHLHDSWNKFRYTEKVSKTCVRRNSYKKSAGCYGKTSAGGYMKQCYCYEEFCNSGTQLGYNFYVVAAITLLFKINLL
ncbi:unnamed protein product [Mytilus edulis]|uniref:Protein sleepless n=1 Tax=Mytilus edulis TaxID=6550 RepID=A0A8S3QZX6_MYTED|nr:unnamed protein product [Mytilus edulis]